MKTENAEIWIVDDVQSNRALFASIVETLGHNPTTFDNGEAVVEAAATAPVPDLVLLDVMMPGMDGFQSCRELRRRFADEMVPIVMITANPDRDMYSRGLEAGADDYLFQPIDLTAMRSRISGMLRLRAAYQELNEHKDKLAQRVELLRREVAEAERQLCLNDRLQSIGMMVAGIAHELKNPLGAVRFNLDWVTDRLNDPPATDVAAYCTDVNEGVDIALEATAALERLVGDLATFARPDREDNSTSNVSQVIDSAFRVTRHTIIAHAGFEKNVPDDLVVELRPRRLAQVIINLIVNGARAVAQTGERGRIAISAQRLADDVIIEVADSGVGLPSEGTSIFDPFYTTNSSDGGTGLGLSICSQIVKRAGGKLGARTSELGGAEIWIRLPAA